MYQLAITQVMDDLMITDRAVAMTMIDQKIATDPSFNATLNAQAAFLGIDSDQLRTHGCWCAKANPAVTRPTGGPPTDIVDWTCKYYIERAECLLGS